MLRLLRCIYKVCMFLVLLTIKGFPPLPITSTITTETVVEILIIDYNLFFFSLLSRNMFYLYVLVSCRYVAKPVHVNLYA